MASNEKAWPEAVFRHTTSVGKNGEILYPCPIRINDDRDRKNYHITDGDCITISFGGSEKVRVYMHMDSNKDLSDFCWSDLNSEHSRKNRESRCMIKGQRKDYIRCPDTRSCSECPYRQNKQRAVISLDSYLEDGHEISSAFSAEDEAMLNIQREELYSLMKSEDPRIEEAYKLKTIMNYDIKEIADILKVSPPRVYQLLDEAKKIIKQYYTD